MFCINVQKEILIPVTPLTTLLDLMRLYEYMLANVPSDSAITIDGKLYIVVLGV